MPTYPSPAVMGDESIMVSLCFGGSDCAWMTVALFFPVRSLFNCDFLLFLIIFIRAMHFLASYYSDFVKAPKEHGTSHVSSVR